MDTHTSTLTSSYCPVVGQAFLGPPRRLCRRHTGGLARKSNAGGIKKDSKNRTVRTGHNTSIVSTSPFIRSW